MRLFFLCLTFALPTLQPASAAVDDTLLSMAPASSMLLAGIDVTRASSSRSGKYVLEQTLADEDIAKVITTTGLDVHRNVQHILLVGLGRQAVPDAQHAAILRGTFDSVQLIAAARRRGVTLTPYRSFNLLVRHDGKAASALVFPRAGVLISGDLATVETILGSHTASDNANPTLREQVNRAGPANDIWFATLLSGSFLAQQTGDALTPQLRKAEVLDRISRSSGGLRFGQSDRLTLDLIARSPFDARVLSGLLHVAGSLAHLQTGGNVGLSLTEIVLRSIEIEVEGSTVHATSAIPDEELERALTSGR